MNTVAYEENVRNKRYIRRTNGGALIVDTSKVTYQNYPWTSLSSYMKRKFENRLFMQYPKELLHFIYE